MEETKEVRLTVLYAAVHFVMDTPEEMAKEHILNWIKCRTGEQSHVVRAAKDGSWAYSTAEVLAMSYAPIQESPHERLIKAQERWAKAAEKEANRGDEWQAE